ncbi:hypothetical protein [Pantoea stewartii]|uniref:hypothetical protein n=1 Tax=Pantoea stewartii TaxID=66269 RepID=UPI003867D378
MAASQLRVEFRRIGYDAICTLSPANFVRDFEYMKGKVNESDVARFMSAADGDEKIRVLREIIQERMYRK